MPFDTTTYKDTVPADYKYGNVENIWTLVKLFRTGEYKTRFGTTFDMGHWDFKDSGCGTAACIGGHIELLTGEDDLRYSEAGEWLGLNSRDDSAELFFVDSLNMREVHGFEIIAPHATDQHAANVLEHYARTGIVDWERVCPEAYT